MMRPKGSRSFLEISFSMFLIQREPSTLRERRFLLGTVFGSESLPGQWWVNPVAQSAQLESLQRLSQLTWFSQVSQSSWSSLPHEIIGGEGRLFPWHKLRSNLGDGRDERECNDDRSVGTLFGRARLGSGAALHLATAPSVAVDAPTPAGQTGWRSDVAVAHCCANWQTLATIALGWSNLKLP